jgi:hypothetical protein
VAPLLLFVASCASAPPAGRTATPGAPGSAPFSAPPAAAHEIHVSVDTRAAQEILGSLSRSRFDMTDVKILEDMLPIKLTIQDSGRPADVFQHDFMAAWDPETRTAVFDFAFIRREKEKWNVVLAAVSSGREEIERQSAARAAALLPGDRTISAKLAVFVTFGVAGLADHLVTTTPDGTPALIVDLARVLGEGEGGPPSNQITRLVRLISGSAYQQAWSVYRQGSTAWKRAMPALGPLDPFVRVVAEVGPVSIFGIEDSFFPLSTWLSQPMQRAINELNRMGERLVESEGDLDVRIMLASEVKKPDFARRVGGPAGAYMEDGIIQVFGLDVLRGTLAAGPLAFFQQYARATKQDKNLPMLSKVIEDRLAAAATPAPR